MPSHAAAVALLRFGFDDQLLWRWHTAAKYYEPCGLWDSLSSTRCCFPFLVCYICFS